MERLSKYNTIETVSEVIKLAEDGANVIFFDLETTGLSKKTDRILSFSAIKTKYKDGRFEESDRMNVFINPGFHISDEVSAINHITDETVANCEEEDEVVYDIIRFIGDDPVLCGYNSDSFDVPFLQSTYERAAGIDLAYAKTLDVFCMVKDCFDFNDYKLSSVSHELGCDIGLEFHNSIDDVIATIRVCNFILSEIRNRAKSKQPLVYLEVTGWHHFKMSHKVNRVYIHTYPYTTTYYDIYRGEWKTDMRNGDLKTVRKELFSMLAIKNEKELAKAVM